jgi:potassium voltage-gated channel Eag-related subfamily H protein 7
MPSTTVKSGSTKEGIVRAQTDFNTALAVIEGHLVTDLERLKFQAVSGAITELCTLAQINASEGKIGLRAPLDGNVVNHRRRNSTASVAEIIAVNGRTGSIEFLRKPVLHNSADRRLSHSAPGSPAEASANDEAATILLQAEMLHDARPTSKRPTRRGSVVDFVDGVTDVAKRLFQNQPRAQSRSKSGVIKVSSPFFVDSTRRASKFDATNFDPTIHTPSAQPLPKCRQVPLGPPAFVAASSPTSSTDSSAFRRMSAVNSKESGEELGNAVSRLAIHPESERLFWWQCLIIMLVLESAVEVPYAVGFHTQPLPTALTILFEIIFVFDVCINFLIGYVDSYTHDTIMDVRLTSSRYLFSFFAVDLVASIPTELISLLTNNSELGDVRVIKALRMIKIFRLVRLLRLDALKSVEGEASNPGVLRLFKLFCVFMFVLHLVACGYWFLAREEGLGSDDWVPPADLMNKGFTEQYAFAFHWAILVTIGNDAKPVTYNEHVYSGCIMLAGIAVFASIIGGASSLLSNLDLSAQAQKQQMDSINQYLRFRRVPSELRLKIRNYYKYLWLTGQALHHKKLFDSLPQTLSLQLNLALKRKLIETSSLFKHCSPVSVVSIIRRLVSFVAVPEERIMKQGELGTRVYFIVRGGCSVWVKPKGGGDELQVNLLAEGSHFGEMGVLQGEGARSATVIADTFCMMEMLLGEDFTELLDTFPDIMQHVMSVAARRHKRADLTIESYQKEQQAEQQAAGMRFFTEEVREKKKNTATWRQRGQQVALRTTSPPGSTARLTMRSPTLLKKPFLKGSSFRQKSEQTATDSRYDRLAQAALTEHSVSTTHY